MNKKILITKKEINHAVVRIARAIRDEYRYKPLVLLINLKGGAFFGIDLYNKIGLEDLEIDFVQTSSYQGNLDSSEHVIIKRSYMNCDVDLKNKYVLIVDDIVDTGKAFTMLVESLENAKPKDIKTCALINKHERRSESIKVDYYGFDIQKGYLVGYGMAVGDKYRCLPDIYTFEGA